MSDNTSDTTIAAAAPEVTAPAEFASEQATTSIPAEDLAKLAEQTAPSTETDAASIDPASFDAAAKELQIEVDSQVTVPTGERVLFSFVDHESHKLRPAVVVQGYPNGHADLFVMFHPSDRIAGANATPGIVMDVKYRLDPEVETDAIHRCWY